MHAPAAPRHLAVRVFSVAYSGYAPLCLGDIYGVLPPQPDSAAGDSLLAYAPRILIVDDESAVQRLFEAVLSQDGYSVSAVGTARHALLVLRDIAFDLVIVDMSLPDMPGLELLGHIRSESPLSRVLAISGFMEGPLRDTVTAAGAAAVLTKPVAPRELQDAVYRLLDPSCSWMGSAG
jgi:CheY-like chemotaxis protein